MTNQPWLTSGLAAMFAWLTNVPGSLKAKIGGMLAFATGAIVITIISAKIGTSLWPYTIAVALVGFLGTLVFLQGMRTFMVGFTLICWTIYSPGLVAATSLGNCVLAIVLGTTILIALIISNEKAMIKPDAGEDPNTQATESGEGTVPDRAFVFAYATTVALVLAITTYYGTVELRTDPTLMVGAAIFVIGFDARKTWIAGLARLIGLTLGTLLGLLLAELVGAGPLLQILMIAACCMSFAAGGIHPGAWMFFFMVFVAMGWHGLDAETFNLTIREKFYGETMGVVTAMIGVVFLQWWQRTRG